MAKGDAGLDGLAVNFTAERFLELFPLISLWFEFARHGGYCSIYRRIAFSRVTLGRAVVTAVLW
jgi:hypothetical protein